MSTETLASCADAMQTEAPKTIDANRDGFIIHQVILAPLARTPKVGCRVSPAIGCLPECRYHDARKVRGTIVRSINVDSLQRHHELGRSVTNEGGVSPSAAPTCRRDGWHEDHILLAKLAHQPLQSRLPRREPRYAM
jgi:hypothetical protein